MAAMINDRDREAIIKIFDENLVNPVKMTYFTIPTSPLLVPGRATCETCPQVQQLCEEVASLSDKIELEVHNLEQERELAQQMGVTRVPALLLSSEDEVGVRYFGAPAGYEFATLIKDIQTLSTGQTALEQPTRDALAAIPDPIHLQVFVTPT